MAFLISYFRDEFDHFQQRTAREQNACDAERPAVVQHAIAESLALRAAHARLEGRRGQARLRGAISLRKWASMRMQCFYRTVSGMMRTQQALELLLRTQIPQVSERDLLAILKSKFTCLAALQRYHTMSMEELDDVEILLAEFPLLSIAYIEHHEQAEPAQRSRYFSCLIDGSCQLDRATGRRVPKFRVELPGFPILGNGKSDNQNHAIIFSRGTVIQTIDANQGGAHLRSTHTTALDARP